MRIYDRNGGILSRNGGACRLSFGDPYNPLGLPPFTIRLKFTEGATPTFGRGTGVQVSTSPNIWDLTYENASWYDLLNHQPDIIEALGANTDGVLNMDYMFANAPSLTSVALFDTSKVALMNYMFSNCESLVNVPPFDTSSVIEMNSMFSYCKALTSVPLFDTSKVTDMGNMFHSCGELTTVNLFDTSSCTSMFGMFDSCVKVKSGALALYQQASSQANPPSNHLMTFFNCGSSTVTGAAELAQIPSDWK